MKYAIFGGSFDPPHKGHEAAALAVFEQLKLDEVIWVPANRNPLKKKSSVSVEDRLRMVQLAVENHPQFAMSDIEITRSGRSYSIETVTELSRAIPGRIWFIMGADSLATITDWKSPEKFVGLCRFALVNRPGSDVDKVLGTAPDWVKEMTDIVEMSPVDISSTELRHRLFEGTLPSHWLEPSVLDYIIKNNLYKK